MCHLTDDHLHAHVQATRNGIRVSDLRDYEAFADKLRKLALDGAKRFEGFDYDVEADLEAYLKIIPRVLPLITDTVPTLSLASSPAGITGVLGCCLDLLTCSCKTPSCCAARDVLMIGCCTQD